jgi:hypothetical protein
MRKKMMITLLVAGLLLATILALGFTFGPFDGTLILDDDLHMHGMGWMGGLLGVTIAGLVMLLVGVLLAFVFTGVSVLLLCVGALVACILLAVALPFFMPLVAMVAVPLMVLYALFRKMTQPAIA